ncbi:hypothetical protein TNCV_1351591 [Trichonephila clavipes]|nr:hypothetical protein TNCV_1351591 [Trichonephila clavipes]
MDRPAFLPDSNPVESLWDRLDRLFTEPVNYLLHIYGNFRKHCLMSGVIFPKNQIDNLYSAFLGVVRTVLPRLGDYCVRNIIPSM